MRRSIIVLAVAPLSCLLLLSCSSGEKAVTNNVIVESSPGLPPRPTPEPRKTPKPIPRSSKPGEAYVRLRVVDSEGDPLSGVQVDISPSAISRPYVSDGDGEVVASGGKCNSTVLITLNAPRGILNKDLYEDTSYTRVLRCAEGYVDLGDLELECICPDCKPTNGMVTVDPCDPRRPQPN